MSRISTGWRLAKKSFALMRDDRSLAVFPLLSAIFIAIALALTLTPGLVLGAALDRDWIVLPFMVAGGYAATFFVVYFNVALAGATRVSMDGGESSVADGLVVARRRRSLIAQWALLQFVFGVLTRFAQRLMGESAGGMLAAVAFGMVGLAWSVSTFFAVPLLALEGLGPRAALKRSASLVRERWGEGLVGYTAITFAVLMVALVPLLVLFQVAFAAIEIDPTIGAAVGVVAILALIVVCTMGSALGVIFRVELYRYSTAGETTGAFAQQDIAAAFGPVKGSAS